MNGSIITRVPSLLSDTPRAAASVKPFILVPAHGTVRSSQPRFNRWRRQRCLLLNHTAITLDSDRSAC
ncbi:hypothetical protein LDENG_00288090 [Lucifuga dentata]|nr:hypothetical protein LDENG_00288090 [Lucifuga dentata]